MQFTTEMSCGRDRQLCHQTSPSGLARPSQDTNVHYHNYSSESAENVYTECTAEHLAEQQVSDGGPRSLYKHLPASTVLVFAKHFGLSRVSILNVYPKVDLFRVEGGKGDQRGKGIT